MKRLKKVALPIVIIALITWFIMDIRPLIINTESSLQEQLSDTVTVEKKKERLGYIRVRTTYYNPVEAQCDSTPLITADGSRINKEKLRMKKIKWIAISPDLLVEYPLGTKVSITSKKYPEISGIYEIHDVMNPRFKYSIDILSHEDHGHIFGTHLCEMKKA